MCTARRLLGLGAAVGLGLVSAAARAEDTCEATVERTLAPGASAEAVIREAEADLQAGRSSDAGGLLLALARREGPAAPRAKAALTLLELLTRSKRAPCIDAAATLAPDLASRICAPFSGASAPPPACDELTRAAKDVGVSVARLSAEALVTRADKTPGREASRLLYREAGRRYERIWVETLREPCARGDRAGCARADEIVYNAARAFQAAHETARARELRALLFAKESGLADSTLGRRALYEQGGSFQATADYAEAADLYERFASAWPTNEQAPTALLDATVLRLGLHDAPRATADVERFVKTYAKKRPEDAAKALFAVASEAFVAGRLAETQARASSALALAPPPDLVPQLELLVAESIRGQKKKLTPEARAAYQRAAGADPEKLIRRDLPEELSLRSLAKALIAVGRAKLALADERGAEALALQIPKGDKDALAKKRAAVEAAEKAYQGVVAIQPMPPPVQVVDAAARVARLRGQLWARAELAFGGEVGELHLAQAKASYKSCVEYGVKYQAETAGSRACAAWLAKHFPGELAAPVELAPAPRFRPGAPRERPAPLDRDGDVWIAVPPEP